MNTPLRDYANVYAVRDLMDIYVSGLVFELKRDIRREFGDNYVSEYAVGEMAESSVLAAMEHECLLEHSNFLDYVQIDQLLNKWYETNIGRYSDHFLEVLPMRSPYTDDPEKYANIWGNLCCQMIGVVVGNIKED